MGVYFPRIRTGILGQIHPPDKQITDLAKVDTDTASSGMDSERVARPRISISLRNKITRQVSHNGVSTLHGIRLAEHGERREALGQDGGRVLVRHVVGDILIEVRKVHVKSTGKDNSSAGDDPRPA